MDGALVTQHAGAKCASIERDFLQVFAWSHDPLRKADVLFGIMLQPAASTPLGAKSAVLESAPSLLPNGLILVAPQSGRVD
jgi:hypothetical protein